MQKFNTLLLREWMQHHRGWLALMLAPPMIVLLMLPFSSLDVGAGRGELPPALGLMLVGMVGAPAVVLGLTAASLLFQTPGLARRDRQDRSIEFWLSLPASHSASLGATVLMHLLLVPLLALVVGAAFGVAIGIALVWKAMGVAEAFALPWGLLATAGAAALLRALLGVVLAVAWLMPLLLAVMAASAWLKRWGVPVLFVGGSIAHALLARLYGITWIGDVLRALLLQARSALFHGRPPQTHGSDAIILALQDAPGWLAADALAALRALAQPLFLFAIVASAGCFALLVWRRRRSG